LFIKPVLVEISSGHYSAGGGTKISFLPANRRKKYG
jgi:hypothetical protein